MPLRIDHHLCTLCLRCVEECPYAALEEVDGTVRVTERCTLCGACVDVCPVDAIALRAEEQPSGAEQAEGGVWVYGEHHGASLHPVVFELIGKAAQLARDRSRPLGIALLGHRLGNLMDQFAGFPVDVVYLMEDVALADYADGRYSRALAGLVRQYRPEIVLAGATDRGRSLMPRVAVLCHTGLTADCTGLEIDPDEGDLLQTRPAFGGNVMATIVTRRHRPQMATVRPRVMTPPPRGDGGTPRVERWQPPADLLEGPDAETLGLMMVAEDTADLAEAEVLVAGGRGMGGPEGFDMLWELADLVGGEVAASRAAVDAGWAPYARQVGQTGKTVQPDLYLAVGISGAVQHRAGMQSSGCIIAVNVDPDAPIFQIADYGVVGDYREALPELIRLLQKGGER